MEEALQVAAILKKLQESWTPHPAQRQILRRIFKDVQREIFIECGRKFGKALSLDTKIPTEDGWTTIGEIEPGVRVYSDSGKLVRVLDVHEITFNLKCYMVSFSDGSKVKACAEHLWKVESKAYRKSKKRSKNSSLTAEVLTTEQIKENLHCGKEYNYSIPNTKPLIAEEKKLPIHPYVLGCWLGDGNSSYGSICKPDAELYEHIESCGYLTTVHSDGMGHGILGLKKKLRESNLLKNKHIPKEYLRASREQRLALVQGLMDTDGWCQKDGLICEFYNTNKDVADGFYELLVSLGQDAKRKLKTIPGYKDCHIIRFKPDINVFRLSRKANRLTAKKKPALRFITAIEPVQSQPMRCITVEGGMFLCSESMIPTHNSEVVSYFLWRMALLEPGGYYYFAPEQKQAREILWAPRRIQLFGPQDEIASINNTEMRITFKNGSYIKVDGSDNFDSHRGTEPHGIAYDEFRDFRPEFHAVMGPNLAVYKAPLLITTTPPHRDLEHYDGMMAEAKDNRNYFNYPTDVNPYIDKSWLEAEKRKLYARGEGDIWEREYMARRVRGGKKSIFPMFTEEKHTAPHNLLLDTISRDRHKMDWFVAADPATTSCFGMLFGCYHRYTKKVYILAEIYEKSQLETSTSKIIPRAERIKEECFPGYEVRGIEWDQIYDEAASWFRAEAVNSFSSAWTPTVKSMRDKMQGLSAIKDLMLHERLLISKDCSNLISEIFNYIIDDHGKPIKENDHLIDCLRYTLDHYRIGLAQEAEPERVSSRRYYTPEQDLEEASDDDFEKYIGKELA